MFKITKSETFKRTVTVNIPDGDSTRAETLSATFRTLPYNEQEKFDIGTGKGSADFLRAVIVRLDDVADAAGNPIPYDDDLRDQVLALPYARFALSGCYFAEIHGAKLGN